jgi:glutamate/tyrosine decarboxylase-like PLP-dependent enzyme
VAKLAAGVEPFPEEGAGLAAALDGLGRLSLDHGVDPGHPASAAHLHCQPLAAAVAADALVGATNQSLDSWDQGRSPPTSSSGWWPGWRPGSAGTRRWPAGS